MRSPPSLRRFHSLSHGAFACVFLLAAACGGGDSSSGEDTAPPEVTGAGGSGGSGQGGKAGGAGQSGKAGAAGSAAGSGGAQGGSGGASGSSGGGQGGSAAGSSGSSQGGAGGGGKAGASGSQGGSAGASGAAGGSTGGGGSSAGAAGQAGGASGASGQAGGSSGASGSSGNQGGSAGASGAAGGSGGSSGNQGGSAGASGAAGGSSGQAGQAGQAGSGGCSADAACAGTSTPQCCTGVCVNTSSDPKHCGSCGSPCADRPNATTACTMGACEYVCQTGYSDCDGNPDNGCELKGDCACKPGETATCYDGPADTINVGVCKAGTKTCKADGTGFGACQGQVVPSKEVCDGLLVDENCNGQVNEPGQDATCVCTPGTSQSCYDGPLSTLGVGECKAGTKTCAAEGTGFSACAGQVLPGPEVCAPGNTTDENCDGQVNEGGPGSQGCICTPGSFTPCYDGPGGLASPQLTTANGICVAGVQTCNADGASYGACEGEILPGAEVCDGTLTDENCNGQTNEGGQGCQCQPGATQQCWDGPPNAVFGGNSICQKGNQVCTAQGTWGPCNGQVLPTDEPDGVCTANIDENCDGDSLGPGGVDADKDGWTPCQGDCCDIPSQCGTPSLVNPGAYDVSGNNLDDDCDGAKDNAVTQCGTGLATNSANPLDYAKAMDLCQFTTETPQLSQKKWGVISAQLLKADGTGTPATDSKAIRPDFGAIKPKLGPNFALLSTGNAADSDDTSPPFASFQGGKNMGTTSGFPADWFAANGGVLPNAAGCPNIDASSPPNDPVMLKLRIRVPTNAKSFSFNSYFLSAEFPEWVCSPYNDFFVALLDSSFKGTPANPTDKNLAFYDPPPAGGTVYPVGVNLAYLNNGLFRACKNGVMACAWGNNKNITTCTSNSDLVGTGMDPTASSCSSGDQVGGGTGFLQSSGNILPGETIEIRFAIWDTSDHIYDSVVALDNWNWSLNASQPGTVIIQLVAARRGRRPCPPSHRHGQGGGVTLVPDGSTPLPMTMGKGRGGTGLRPNGRRTSPSLLRFE